MFLARITEYSIQSLNDHAHNSAKIAEKDLGNIALGNTAYLSALFHDCGKANAVFQQYLTDSFNGKNVKRGSVIHSFAGVYYFLNTYHNTGNEFEKMTSEIIACAIGSHHGMFDIFNPDKQNGFTKRLQKQPEYEKEAIDGFLSEVIKYDNVPEMFKLSVGEITRLLEKTARISRSDSTEYYFYLGLTCRMISSAVMDGDRTDCANFTLNKAPNLQNNTSEIWTDINKNIEKRLGEFKCDTIIQKSRRELSDICFDFSDNESGIYRLNIPTGGGKTLSALRFAVSHALKKNKNRIIYTAPLISILEQNADEIKKASGDKYVLEHHSDVIIDSDNEDENDLRKYLESSWDSPIIATTLTQLLNTLFSSKTSCVRRFQALCNSVIIIDEVQSVPTKMLSLFNLAVNFLSKICNCTVLLCSATLPCLEKTEHSMIIDKSIIDEENFKKYYEIFKRNNIIDGGSLRLDEIPEFIIKKAKENRSLLTVCNKKKEAEFLYKSVKDELKNCFHLSAGMCPAHRKKTLEKIKLLLNKKEPVTCISTQVIEAGVDISFDCALRLSAGMDSVVQTAGRCNRNGENGSDSTVYIIHCRDENLKMLPDIQHSRDASDSLIVKFKSDPDMFSNDLSSESAVEYYYNSLYKNYSADHFDYPIKEKPSIFEMLSDNIRYRDLTQTDSYFLCQSFKTAGDFFSVFDSDSVSVIVPYGEGGDIINNIQTYYNDCDYLNLQREIKKASLYSVSVFDYQFKKLMSENAVIPICGGSFFILDGGYYDEDTGITQNPKEEDKCSILIL